MDNELNEPDCAELFAHMGSCAECRAFFRTSMQIQSTMDELRVPELIGRREPVLICTSTVTKAPPFMSLYRTMRETKIPLSFAAAAVIVAMAGTIALSTFFLQSGRGTNQSTERIVYSYILPTVYVHP